MVRDKRLLARLGLPGHLLFLLRIRFGLYAVLARLGAAADWGELESRLAASVPRAQTAETSERPLRGVPS